MARVLITVIFVVIISLSTGCTIPASGGAGAAGNAIAFRVDGQPVTTQELIALPEIRSSLREYLFRRAVKSAADKMGLKPDMQAIEKQFQDEKQSIIDSGTAWGDWLQTAGFTEDEIKESLITRDLITQYLRAKVNLTDEDLRKAFEQDKEKFIKTYVSQHHLTDAEQSALTFETMKDFVRETIEPMKMQEIQGRERQAFFDGIDLDLSNSFKDPKQAKLFEDLIINFSKSEYRPKPTPQPGEAPPAGPANPATSGGGGAAAPPAGEAAPPAGDSGKDKGQGKAEPPKGESGGKKGK